MRRCRRTRAGIEAGVRSRSSISLERIKKFVNFAHALNRFGFRGTMEYAQRLAKHSIFPLMIAASLVVGWQIPGFYDWTGSDQSRPSPLVPQTAVGLLLSGILACCFLPWLPIVYDPPATDRAVKAQFKIRTLLVITALAAVLLVAFRTMPLLALSGGLQAIVFCYLVRFWIHFPSLRWPTASLLACMYLPYAWIVSWSQLYDQLPAVLWIVSGLPAFFLTLLVGSVADQHAENLTWLSSLMVSAELVMGLWMIRLGPRRFVAYLVFVLILSIFGSFVLNALARV